MQFRRVDYTSITVVITISSSLTAMQFRRVDYTVVSQHTMYKRRQHLYHSFNKYFPCSSVLQGIIVRDPCYLIFLLLSKNLANLHTIPFFPLHPSNHSTGLNCFNPTRDIPHFSDGGKLHYEIPIQEEKIALVPGICVRILAAINRHHVAQPPDLSLQNYLRLKI